MLSLDKIKTTPVMRVVQIGVLVLLLSATTQLFCKDPLPGEGLAKVLTNVYNNGVELRGGGIISLIAAAPLMLLGITPARITVCVLLFVMVMLITGITIADVMRSAYKPVKKLEKTYSEQMEQRDQLKLRREEEAKDQFEFDIDIDDKPVKKKDKKEEASVVDMTGVGPSVLIGMTAGNGAKISEEPPFDIENANTQRRNPQSARERLSNSAQEDLTAVWKSTVDKKAEPVKVAAFDPKGEIDADDIIEGSDEGEAIDLDKLVDKAVNTDSRPTLRNNGRFTVQDDAFAAAKETKKNGKMTEDVLEEAMEELNTAAAKPAPVYNYPPIDLLAEPKLPSEEDVSDELKNNASVLVDTLNSFGVQTRIINISRGPTVTRYELQPSAGVKISKITGLADDIALNLAAAGVRIEAPIPNKAAVGIEVPNKVRSGVSLREIIDSDTFRTAQSKLTAAVGLDISGNVITADLAKMPHLLIAGSTGSGKSVCMNSFIVSLIYKATPEEVRLIMIDPKVVEFNKYNGLPHLLIPVVTDPRKAAGALGWAVSEMMNRYKLFADNGVNDIRSYNRMAEETPGIVKIPQVVIIIDELSDLMMAAPNEVEDYICRLAQMARAAGMHLVIATQRPSVNVITGVIKANIPSRIALMLSSYVDSRTILDAGGAEKLLGNGDMLFHPAGSPKPTRIQGCFVSDEEVKQIVKFVTQQQEVEYDKGVIDEIEHSAVVEKSAKGGGKSADDDGMEEEDPMLAAAIECVIEMGQASTSMLQRKLKLGYSRAGRLMDKMEERGIVGPFEGSKARAILITRQQWLEMKSNME
ncbi:MAG: DNA translocase FtsK [Oscillospiraceae bacterium]|nr:DNA translocase FtsK [Oscillospiraceae bacterium]